MEDNDTYAYHCKTMTNNPHKLSWHAYGMAIDVNPLLNPYVSHSTLLPKTASAYITRNKNIPGTITKESSIYKIFMNNNWKWGGDWRTVKDYHHFEIQRIQ